MGDTNIHSALRNFLQARGNHRIVVQTKGYEMHCRRRSVRERSWVRTRLQQRRVGPPFLADAHPF